MNIKEKFLKLKTYKAFDMDRTDFDELDWNDEDVKNHYMELLGTSDAISKYKGNDVHVDFIK